MNTSNTRAQTFEPRPAPSRLARRLLAAVFLPLGLCLSLLCASSAPAYAQDKAARKKATSYFKKGRTKFKLGDFDEAIRLFKLAYETSPHHAFLFNLGQAYRQKGDCRQAIFFYKGYLTEAGSKAKNRKLVEDHIAELTEICEATDSSKDKPPNDVDEPDGDGEGDGDGDGERVATAGDGQKGGPPGASASVSSSVTITPLDRWQPSLVTSTLILGPSLSSFGAELDGGGAQPGVGVSLGYPLSFGNLGVSVGGMVTFATISEELNGDGGSASLMSALFNIGVRYWVLDKLAIGVDLGAGGLFLAGLANGNMFVDPGDMVTGTLAMPNYRAAVAIDFFLSKNLSISAAPFIYSSSPPKEGLRADVDALSRMEFMVGIGYRM